MSRSLFATVTLLLAALCAAAPLHAQSTPAPISWPIADAPAAFKPAIATAEGIIAAQHRALLGQLARALADGGSTHALKQCHLEATASANATGRELGYATGRTSDRLRSPTNAPRPWAARIVEANAGRQAADVQGFAVDLGDRLGVLRPIAMQPVCEHCHGAPASFLPAVRAALKDGYPADRAVGFKSGELRGWYWVELPKTAGALR